VLNPDNGRLWEIGLQESGEFGPQAERAVKLPPSPIPSPATNTTIGVVATDALLSKAQARKVAQMAHDGLARAIRPSHTMFDGDTVFCLATGKNTLPKTAGVFAVPDAQTLSELGHAAAGCLARSIMAGVLNAESAYGMQAFRDLEDC
jgi:L-aminopeptidase/D-esterase-like protein